MIVGHKLIHALKISKKFPKVHTNNERWNAIKEIVLKKRIENGFNALNQISLEVYKGESVGLIGENGAGKSTLLKLIAGVLHPSTGSISRQGRFSALIELGAGFDPEFSGLDNIRLSGRLAGLSQKEIDSKERSILDFADIGEHIHDPIKTYSSGMVVRLGFAIMTAIEPDLIITDEVLAVGDESFQQKSIRWMENYLKKGGTLLLVSHSMYHIQKLCQKAIWLKNGTVEMSGDVHRVTQAYLAFHRKKSKVYEQARSYSETAYRIKHFYLQDIKDADVCDLEFGADLKCTIELYSPDDRAPNVNIGIVSADGLPIYGISSDMDEFSPKHTGPNCFTCELNFPNLPLLPGTYSIKAHALDPEAIRVFDTVEKEIQVHGNSRELGYIKLDHYWTHISD